MSECNGGTCFPPDQFLGRLLYNGPFTPQFFDPKLPSGSYENFTVTVPDFFGPGKYLLNIYDVSLVGVRLVFSVHSQSIFESLLTLP